MAIRRIPVVGVASLVLPALTSGLAQTTASAAEPSPPTSALGFHGCRPGQVLHRAPGLQCATLHVPLSRSEPNGKQLALAVQRIPAQGTRLGTLVLLAGGPGQAAIGPFEEAIAPLADTPQLRGFELVAFDQRGTGQSGFLRCRSSRAIRRAKTVTARIAACGEQLGSSRGDYTSQESVEDLESLRLALGGNPLSLLAVSYGGRVAGMYAREHPQGVARMVLDSPTPLRGDSALRLEVLHALPRVLDDAICGDGACASFTQDEYGDLVRLLASLARHPITTRIFEGGRHRVSSTITENRVFSLLTEIDLPSLLRNLVPAAISAAADGRPAQLARLTAEYPPQPPPDLLEDPRGLSSEPLPVLFKGARVQRGLERAPRGHGVR